MRKVIYYLLLITVIISLSCRKESELEKLPSATQVGAGTFGCLVDGIAFKPKGNPLGGPILSCAIQNIDGSYYFQLKAFNKASEPNHTVGIFSDSLKIENGNTYLLLNRFTKGELCGLYSSSSSQGYSLYTTNALNTGELKVTKLDTISRIVSGTFWFDAVNKNGQVVKIREGRFDVRFSL